MKTIVFVINDLKGNGAERVVITLCRTMQSMGHRCHIVCFKELTEFDADDLSIHIFPMQHWRWLPHKVRGILISKLLDKFIHNICNGVAPNLILSNLLPCDRIMCESRLPNVYLVVHNTISIDLLSSNRGRSEAYIYQKKPIICVSDGVLTDFQSSIPSTQKSIRIYNPIDIEQTKILAESKTENFPAIGEGFIVHVGKFKKQKRHDILIKAFAASKTTKKLVLVGQGPLLEESQQMVKTLGISDRVVFAGFQKNPYPIIKQASALVLSSDFEGLGMVLLEAMAIGTPAISSDCPYGPAEILHESQLFPCGDIDKLTKLLDSPPPVNLPHPANKLEHFDSVYAANQYLALAQ